MPKLEIDKDLSNAARKLADEIGAKGASVAPEESFAMETRIKESKNGSGSMAENVSFGWKEPRHVILQMVVDDGVKTRGHRLNFFSTMFTHVGIALARHKTYSYCCVFDLFGKSSVQDKTFEKYEIPRDKWPKDAVSLQKHLEMKIKDGKKFIKLTYEFTLPDEKVESIVEERQEDATE